ncbi:hypothetical protein F4808DRAFT_130351 [Astrocystis sublimbata]|nr:hypothetical protein F4808DRAFT_130351 [Astrocystis sublimbata]
MKITALLPIALAATATAEMHIMPFPTAAKRDIDAVASIGEKIKEAMTQLDDTVKAYEKDPEQLKSDTENLIKTLKEGASNIAEGDSIDLKDALGLKDLAGSLTKAGKELVIDLQKKKSAFEESQLCEVVQGNIKDISGEVKGFVDSIVGKLPEETQGIAEKLTKGVTLKLELGARIFLLHCKNKKKEETTSAAWEMTTSSAAWEMTTSAEMATSTPEAIMEPSTSAAWEETTSAAWEMSTPPAEVWTTTSSAAWEMTPPAEMPTPPAEWPSMGCDSSCYMTVTETVTVTPPCDCEMPSSEVPTETVIETVSVSTSVESVPVETTVETVPVMTPSVVVPYPTGDNSTSVLPTGTGAFATTTATTIPTAAAVANSVGAMGLMAGLAAAMFV